MLKNTTFIIRQMKKIFMWRENAWVDMHAGKLETKILGRPAPSPRRGEPNFLFNFQPPSTNPKASLSLLSAAAHLPSLPQRAAPSPKPDLHRAFRRPPSPPPHGLTHLSPAPFPSSPPLACPYVSTRAAPSQIHTSPSTRAHRLSPTSPQAQPAMAAAVSNL